jgi:hypothetical protein
VPAEIRVVPGRENPIAYLDAFDGQGAEQARQLHHEVAPDSKSSRAANSVHRGPQAGLCIFFDAAAGEKEIDDDLGS